MLSRKEPERLMARGRSSREVALPPSVWASLQRSKAESWAGMLLERLMLGPGRVNLVRLVGLTVGAEWEKYSFLIFQWPEKCKSFIEQRISITII